MIESVDYLYPERYDILGGLMDATYGYMEYVGKHWSQLQAALEVAAATPIPRRARRAGCVDVIDFWHWNQAKQRPDWKSVSKGWRN